METKHIYRSHEITMGNNAKATTSEDRSHASAMGNESQAMTIGERSHAVTSGDISHSMTSGAQSISSSLGISSKARAKLGWIIIVDWRQDKSFNWHIIDIYRAKVGKDKIQGILIEPDTWYWLENGKLKSKK